MPSTEIANELSTSEVTLKTKRGSAMRKLGANPQRRSLGRPSLARCSSIDGYECAASPIRQNSSPHMHIIVSRRTVDQRNDGAARA